MEVKKSIIGGICLDAPLAELERIKGLDIIEDASDLITPILFDPNKHYTIGVGDTYLKYKRLHGTLKNVRWGQFKLLLTELDFICRYWDPNIVPNPQIVYIGAAPGSHIAVLSDLFPMITFNLYDIGQKYDPLLNDKKNVKLNKEFKPEEWVGRKDVYLLSDIRRLSYVRGENISDAEAKENERIVWEDMLLQQEWVETVKPVKALLKFRLPYSYDFIKAEGPTRSYLDGIVYRQAWTPPTSTECRLVPYDDLRKRDWDYEHHEGLLFFHNTKMRASLKFLNPLTNTNESLPKEKGLSNDYDSTLTIIIIMGYLTKFRMKTDPISVMKMFDILNKGASGGESNLSRKRMSAEKQAPSREDEDEE